MLLVSAFLLLCAAGGAMLVARALPRRERQVRRLRRLGTRYELLATERARLARSRDEIVATSDGAARAVVLPTEVTRLTHAGIAAIPFTILEQIPATADASRVVRQVHDEISRTVYDAISGTARGVAGVVRGGMRGRRR